MSAVWFAAGIAVSLAVILSYLAFDCVKRKRSFKHQNETVKQVQLIKGNVDDLI